MVITYPIRNDMLCFCHLYIWETVTCRSLQVEACMFVVSQGHFLKYKLFFADQRPPNLQEKIYL